MEYANGKRKDYYLISKLSEYFMAFLSGSIARESCYTCQYSSMNRPGDITMGDFWGYQKKRPDLRHDQGLSLIIVNSTRGERILNELRSLGICFNEVDAACVEASENKNLYYPTKRSEIRNRVYEELEQHGFEYIANKYFRKTHTWKNKLKNYLPPVVVNILKNMK
jgi:coenzyme F420-reducing hydrogenase beta subunit